MNYLTLHSPQFVRLTNAAFTWTLKGNGMRDERARKWCWNQSWLSDSEYTSLDIKGTDMTITVTS